MTRAKIFLPLFAILLCLGALLFPATAFAQAAEDTTPPTVTATLSSDTHSVATLQVVAKDDHSGVAAIYINEHRFATLVNGTATVKLKEYAGTEKQVTVYAVDMAGNRSKSVLIDNPYYIAPVTPLPAVTPVAQVTPAPSATVTVNPTPTPNTPATITPIPNEPATPSATPEPTRPQEPDAGADDPAGETPDGSGTAVPGTAFTPDGSGAVMDNATESDGKEFFTITSESGSVYYLIIDRQRGTENVYFLNTVTEADLLGLAQGTGSAIPDTPGGNDPAPQPTQPADPEPTPEPEEPKKSGGNTGAILFIILAVLAVGGAGYYLKIVKPRQQAAQQDDEEYEDEEFDEFGEEQEEEYLFADELDAYESEATNTQE
ncbi:DUF4366 domain-containing protein [Eubacteriales bacterium OttesenSCG-928-K08]|nr:DUF4366 domain-containing protein [Eubacteriales bacterium OttesenSCG-928-K08]